MSIWKELIHVEYLGPFVNTDKGKRYKTWDARSSLDSYYNDRKSGWGKASYRFREISYTRVDAGNGKYSIILYLDNGRYISPEFDEVYYLPFHKCFMGVGKEKVVLFSAAPNKVQYLFEETLAKVFVYGNFFFYSLDGVKWGLWDSEVRRKIEPFVQLEEVENQSLNHTWTDEYYPVRIDNYYYLMDCHGTCFCKSLSRIYKYKNIFATYCAENTYPHCFGLNEKNELAVVRKDVKGESDKEFLCEVDSQKLARVLNAYGQRVSFEFDPKYRPDYYYRSIPEGKIRCEYFPHFLDLKGYEFCYKRLYTCFWLIKCTDNAEERYGIINTETNEIIVEPVCEEIKTYGSGMVLTYGDRYLFMNEQGEFYKTEKRTL